MGLKRIFKEMVGKEPEEVAKMIVDDYMDMKILRRIALKIRKIDIGLGVIDLEKLDVLIEFVKTFSKVNPTAFRGLHLNEFERYRTVDLYSLAREVKDEGDQEAEAAAKKLMEAIDDSVIYLKYRSRDCHGISITFPKEEMNENWDFKDLYSELVFSELSSWDDLLFSVMGDTGN